MTVAEQAAEGTTQKAVHTRALIIGTGFSGLGMGIALQKQGVDFLILEKADDVGGTWRDNTYPGCACDVPSHLYSFSFEPKATWSKLFSPQPEILDYLKGVTDKYGLRRYIRFDSRVDRAHWDDAEYRWHVFTDSGAGVRRAVPDLGCGRAAHSADCPTSRGWTNSAAPLSIPRSGTTASTSPASGSRSSGPAPVPSRSCPSIVRERRRAAALPAHPAVGRAAAQLRRSREG